MDELGSITRTFFFFLVGAASATTYDVFEDAERGMAASRGAEITSVFSGIVGKTEEEALTLDLLDFFFDDTAGADAADAVSSTTNVEELELEAIASVDDGDDVLIAFFFLLLLDDVDVDMPAMRSAFCAAVAEAE